MTDPAGPGPGPASTAAERRRGWLTLLAVAVIAAVVFALVWLAQVLFYVGIGADPLDKID